MNRVDKKFRQLKKEKKKAFIAYVTAGDPGLAVTARLIPEMEKAGVDVLELGVPFSDPLADGLTIQRASERALAKDAFLPDILNMVKKVRKKVRELPILLMSYYNPIYKHGLKKFVNDVEHITFSGKYAVKTGQTVLYVTERCVFKLTENGMELIEVAPGVDSEKDILSLMEFAPVMNKTPEIMDRRIFRPDTMGLSTNFR